MSSTTCEILGDQVSTAQTYRPKNHGSFSASFLLKKRPVRTSSTPLWVVLGNDQFDVTNSTYAGCTHETSAPYLTGFTNVVTSQLGNLNDSFSYEYNRLLRKGKTPPFESFLSFNEVSKRLAKLLFESSTIHLGDPNCIKFNLKFKENSFLFITKYYNPSTIQLQEDQVMFSIAIDSKIISAGVENLSSIAERLD